MKIYLSNRLSNKEIVYYTLQLIALNKQVGFDYVEAESQADVSVGFEEEGSIQISSRFNESINCKRVQFQNTLDETAKVVLTQSGETDYLSTIFYYVNCLQEFNSKELDNYGRFKYAASAQCKFGTLKTNFVQQLIDDFCDKFLPEKKLAERKRKSGFFLTHDIDDVFKAKNEDGKYALMKGKWHHIPRLLWNHYLGNPDLLNMNDIVSMEQQYGFSSTFFWLPVKSKMNADYDFQSELIQMQYRYVAAKGCSNGIHKAWAATTFEEEMKMFPEKVEANRYHFLKFIFQDLRKPEMAGIRLDSSLGFSEEFGFRNNYGLPFMPFDVEENRVLNMLEVPMHVMDRTFFNKNQNPETAAEEVLRWIDENSTDCIFTINWHNNFFTNLKYNGYRNFYEQLLKRFSDNNMPCYTPKQLMEEFYRPDFFTIPKHLA